MLGGMEGGCPGDVGVDWIGGWLGGRLVIGGDPGKHCKPDKRYVFGSTLEQHLISSNILGMQSPY